MIVRRYAFILAAAIFAIGCSSSGPPRKETFPVTGVVVVDGSPASFVQVQLHNQAGFDTNMPTHSEALTDAEGKFELSTYEKSDGVPAGDYAVTFMWGQLNVLSNQYGGPDKLKGRYADPKKTPIKVKVEEGKPTDMGRVELTTK